MLVLKKKPIARRARDECYSSQAVVFGLVGAFNRLRLACLGALDEEFGTEDAWPCVDRSFSFTPS